ncbi:hypothetical protein BKA80DRAFT_263097 [Phyllosticta citrichinensis]
MGQHCVWWLCFWGLEKTGGISDEGRNRDEQSGWTDCDAAGGSERSREEQAVGSGSVMMREITMRTRWCSVLALP